MTTYSKNGIISGKFNSIRNDLFDDMGKKFATNFFISQGGVAEANDLDTSGKRLYENPDIKVYFPEKDLTIFIEAEIKTIKYWGYIYEGVDIPARKYKYAKNTNCKGFFFMGRNDLQEFLLIPMKWVSAAREDCGDEYLGWGRGNVSNSKAFLMPDHGCHRVRKICNAGEGKGSNIEDFIRIPYGKILHYIKTEDKFKRKN